MARRRAGIGAAVRLLSDAGARRAGMTGSGSAVFGIFERRGAALVAARRLRGRPEAGRSGSPERWTGLASSTGSSSDRGTAEP